MTEDKLPAYSDYAVPPVDGYLPFLEEVENELSSDNSDSSETKITTPPTASYASPLATGYSSSLNGENQSDIELPLYNKVMHK